MPDESTAPMPIERTSKTRMDRTVQFAKRVEILNGCIAGSDPIMPIMAITLITIKNRVKTRNMENILTKVLKRLTIFINLLEKASMKQR